MAAACWYMFTGTFLFFFEPVYSNFEWSRRKPTSGRGQQVQSNKQLTVAMVPHRLTYQFLTEITDNFSKERELGEGAFGQVFRVR